MQLMLEENYKIPRGQIDCFRNGKVESVRLYSLCGGLKNGVAYRRWGDRYFIAEVGQLEEHEIAYDLLPAIVQRIFDLEQRVAIEDRIRDKKDFEGFSFRGFNKSDSGSMVRPSLIKL